MSASLPRRFWILGCSVACIQLGLAASYTIKPGDSLERIARKHGCTVEALVKANGLKTSAVIHPGQTLTLPGDTAAAETPAAPAKPAADGTHTVQAGDTLYAISRKYGIPVAKLQAANPGLKPNAIRPGQKIRLAAASKPAASPAPKPAPAVEPAPTPAVAATPPPQPAPTPSAPPVVGDASSPVQPAAPADAQAESPPSSTAPAAEGSVGVRTVIVETEMTFGEFAAKHGTDIDRLNDLNGLDLSSATVLAQGSELYVPAQP